MLGLKQSGGMECSVFKALSLGLDIGFNTRVIAIVNLMLKLSDANSEGSVSETMGQIPANLTGTYNVYAERQPFS